MSMLELNCFILGDDPSKIFGVKILRTKLVNALKDSIKETLSPKLNHVAALDLTVWKVSLPEDAITQELTATDVPEPREYPNKCTGLSERADKTAPLMGWPGHDAKSHRLVIRCRYVALPASSKYEPKQTSAPPSPSRDTLPQSATSVGWFRASSTKRTSSNVFHVGNGSMIRATQSVQMHQPDCYFYNTNKRDTHGHPIPDPSNPTTDTPDTVNNPLCNIQTTEEQASTSNEGLHEKEPCKVRGYEKERW
ncbi:hypothetical protein EDD15DRAFT_2393796 [Pisolithus albus]|nr:hypothetical protein EDD15DRAFT_2393796 [Pisolithus albus]